MALSAMIPMRLSFCCEGKEASRRQRSKTVKTKECFISFSSKLNPTAPCCCKIGRSVSCGVSQFLSPQLLSTWCFLTQISIFCTVYMHQSPKTVSHLTLFMGKRMGVSTNKVGNVLKIFASVHNFLAFVPNQIPQLVGVVWNSLLVLNSLETVQPGVSSNEIQYFTHSHATSCPATRASLVHRQTWGFLSTHKSVCEQRWWEQK